MAMKGTVSLAAESKEEMEDDYDPTARSCGWCYSMLKQPSFDAGTNSPGCPRIYCSPDCCVLDKATHAFWCGKAGEKGVDFELCDMPGGKGLGLVARRSFARGEKILSERPVFTTGDSSAGDQSSLYSKTENDGDDLPDSLQQNIRTAAMALTPQNPSLDDKIRANGVSVATSPNDKTSGLFLTFSRVNHDCVGNSDHYFDHQHGVQVLVANDDIPAGTEITFPYTRTGKQRLEDLEWRGFTCACRACGDSQEEAKDDDWGWKVNRIVELEKNINSLNSKSQDIHREQAVQSAKAMLDLYAELGVSDREYARTHYDLFQILVLREQSLDQAHSHITKAYQHALRFCGYEGHEIVQQFRHYRNHPESHGNYRAIN
jgi:SET domain